MRAAATGHSIYFMQMFRVLRWPPDVQYHEDPRIQQTHELANQ